MPADHHGITAPLLCLSLLPCICCACSPKCKQCVHMVFPGPRGWAVRETAGTSYPRLLGGAHARYEVLMHGAQVPPALHEMRRLVLGLGHAARVDAKPVDQASCEAPLAGSSAAAGGGEALLPCCNLCVCPLAFQTLALRPQRQESHPLRPCPSCQPRVCPVQPLLVH